MNFSFFFFFYQKISSMISARAREKNWLIFTHKHNPKKEQQ